MLNVKNELQHLTPEVIKEIRVTVPFAVCCLNIEGRLNISTIIRSAEAFGAEKVFIFGKRRFDLRGCVGSQNYIPIEKIDGLTETGEIDVNKFIEYFSNASYQPICCEVGYMDYRTFSFRDYSDRAPMLVVGEEQKGIPHELLAHYPKIGIPMIGVGRSFNVGVAASIVMDEMSRQVRT